MSNDRIIEKLSLKNISGKNAKRILESADQEDIDIEKIEKIIKFINKLKGGEKMSDEKMTEEQYAKKQKEDLGRVEEYIEKHPKTDFREAVLAVLGKDDLTGNERKVEEYIESHEGCTYREAVLAVLDRSEPEPKKEE